jgi:hypothetical protein
MSYDTNKKQQSMVFKPSQYESERVPFQFSNYINEQSTRFGEICKLYLDGMNMDDVRYMRPEDLINLVPSKQYRHKLLMTIMVRRYIFRDTDDEEELNNKIRNPVGRTDVFCSKDSCDNDMSTSDSGCNKCKH